MPKAAAHSTTIRQGPRHPELAEFLLKHAIKRGSFKLSSGRTSSYYCDGKLVSFSGEGLSLIVDAIVQELKGLEVDAIGGMDMGATPIVAAAALRLHQLGLAIPSFVVRKEVKAHGTQKDVEGLLPAKPGRLVIVDDVVTSAESILKSIDAVTAKGHVVVLAISVLDRDGGGAERIRARGIPYQPLVTIGELGITNDPPGAAERQSK